MICPTRLDFPRLNTVVIEAYAAEPSRRQLFRVRDKFRDLGASFEPRIMASHGGTISMEAGQLVTEHTFFQASFVGSELDLTRPPWVSERDAWRDPDDYSHCQSLAADVRGLEPPVQAIRYESARREGGMCEVVFAPASLA